MTKPLSGPIGLQSAEFGEPLITGLLLLLGMLHYIEERHSIEA
ncbi:hypothetical protein [Streptomyces sp. NPDC005407]